MNSHNRYWSQLNRQPADQSAADPTWRQAILEGAVAFSGAVLILAIYVIAAIGDAA